MTSTVLLQTGLDILIAGVFLVAVYIAYGLGSRSRDKEVERLTYLLSPEHRAEQIKAALDRQRAKERARGATLINVSRRPASHWPTHEPIYDWSTSGL